ncbi:TetR/AcrR family transcriptional regulator [endosymbiont of Lamellibrachia barhami]|uniref:TetR/AcrR family transcriptional regulator n=1 Tax=endosymbiont of Lamellibrachia barhami TaxID=205975 RepID=UPI0015AFF863
MSNTRTAILKAAILLFSKRGYEGVSMRNIAGAVNISTPALYNHFKDKQSLYIAVITDTFENKSELLLQALTGQQKPILRLQNFITRLSEMLHDDPDFRRLMQRELLDGDEKRLRYLAQEVFGSSFQCMMDLLIELKPDCDAHSLAVIIIGMVQKPYELNPLDRFFPGSQQQHKDPAYISKQVMAVLSAYLGDRA